MNRLIERIPGNRHRRLAAGMLAAALALGGMAAGAPRAYAEEGSVTIEQQANADAVYDVYPVFTADVEDGTREADDRTAIHIKWASSAVKAAVLAYLAQADASWSGDNPQEAAEYIGEAIAAGAVDEDAGTTPATPAAGSFAAGLAQALARAGLEPATATAGEAFTAPEGLYLFVTAPASIGAGEAGSAAMWVPIGSSAKTITEKAAAGTVEKRVKEDSTGQWGHAADAAVAQDVQYQVETTMPADIGAFATYHWKIADTLPAGMEAVADADGRPAVSLAIGDVDISAAAGVSYEGRVLTVDVADLLATAKDAGATVAGGTAVTLSYAARIVPGAAAGGSGHLNSAVYTHTADPVGEGDVSDTPVTALAYTYALRLVKVDKATGAKLAGARYTVQVADDNADGASRGLYVQADGSLGAQAHEFVTGEDGDFAVSGIDEGRYTIRETGAPDGYDLQDDDIRLQVSPAFDGLTGELSGIDATLTGGEAAEDDAETATQVSAADAATGLVTVTASDDKRTTLPLTGLDGSAALYLGAAAVAAGTLAAYARRRAAEAAGRQAEDDG